MRLILGLFLMLAGGAVMVTGIVLALISLGGLYQGYSDDPLGQPDDAVDVTRQGMFRGVILGATGIIPFIAGSVMVKGAVARKLYQLRKK